MAPKKACKNCRMFVSGETCPSCNGNQFTTTWKGRLYVVDPNTSLIAQQLGIKVKGEYAIKVR